MNQLGAPADGLRDPDFTTANVDIANPVSRNHRLASVLPDQMAHWIKTDQWENLAARIICRKVENPWHHLRKDRM